MNWAHGGYKGQYWGGGGGGVSLSSNVHTTWPAIKDLYYKKMTMMSKIIFI